MSPLVIPAISLGAKLLGGLFGRRSQNAQTNEGNRAQTAALALRQKQMEDARRARLAYGQGLLGRVTQGVDGSGGSMALSPELFAQLDKERTYNFAGTATAPKGGASSFLSGLFGGAADVLPYVGAGGGNAHSGDPSDPTFMGPQVPGGVTSEELRNLTRTRGPM